VAVKKLGRYKSPGINQDRAKVIRPESRQHKLINSFRNKEELPQQWRSQSLYFVIRRVIKVIMIFIEVYRCYPLHTIFYTSFCQGKRRMQAKLLGIIYVDFYVTNRLLTKYHTFVKYLRKNCNKWGSASVTYVHQESL